MAEMKPFFDTVRKSLFGGRLSADQVSGLATIHTEAPEGMSLEHLAYCLATVFHETDQTMQPIVEYGKGRGKTYGVPDPKTGQAYYGRGYVQLTWKANYQKAKDELGPDFVSKPDLALEPENAAQIMFRGMTEGWFTGKKLVDYFGPGKADPKNARRIINGTDKADLIADYYGRFLAGLKAIQPDTARAICPACKRPLAA